MELNDEQKLFISSPNPSVLVACPGGGKTTAIAYKFCRMIEKWKSQSSGIAMLSFTNVASIELEEKVLICNSNNVSFGYPHFIGTIDSFFNNILKRFGYLIFGKTPSFTLDFTQKYKKPACYKCSNKDWKANLTIEGKYVVNNSDVKCSIESFACFKYFKTMLDKGIILQNSVPFFLKKLFEKHENVLSIIAKRYPVIIIDEAQDTSLEQAYIFDLLEKNGVIINYVGDPDQSIYEWRNAYPKFFYDKMNDKSYDQIRFIRNNRSSQKICDATKVFGELLSKTQCYISESKHKDFPVKPILIQYDSGINRKEIEEFFFNKISEYGLSLDKKKYAILQNFKDNDEISFSDIYDNDNKFMFYYMNGVYEFFYGKRKICDENFLNCLRILHSGDVTSLQDDLIKGYMYQFYKTIVRLDNTIEEWEEETKNRINIFVENNKDVFPHQFCFNFKSRMMGISKYKRNVIKDMFQITKGNTTIHSVKGKTFESVLLYTEKNRKVNGKLLISKRYNEQSRVAFVAMTRAQKLLCVAVESGLDYLDKFPASLWEYAYLKKER